MAHFYGCGKRLGGNPDAIPSVADIIGAIALDHSGQAVGKRGNLTRILQVEIYIKIAKIEQGGRDLHIVQTLRFDIDGESVDFPMRDRRILKQKSIRLIFGIQQVRRPFPYRVNAGVSNNRCVEGHRVLIEREGLGDQIASRL